MPASTRCNCTDESLAARPRADVSSYTVSVVDGLPDKAKIFPGTGQIQVDRAFWGRISELQRRAVLAHELAHDEDVEACEDCTDARAGARLRYEGVSLAAAANALGGVVSSRPRARESVVRGWQAADEALSNRERERDAGDLMHKEALGPRGVAPRSRSLAPETIGQLRRENEARGGMTDAERAAAAKDYGDGVSEVTGAELVRDSNPAKGAGVLPKSAQDALAEQAAKKKSDFPWLLAAGVALVAVALLRRG